MLRIYILEFGECRVALRHKIDEYSGSTHMKDVFEPSESTKIGG